MKGIGKRIAEARKAADMSQDDLGRACGGLSRAAVSQWEREDTTPDLNRVEQLSKVLQVSVEWLRTGQKNATPVYNLVASHAHESNSDERGVVLGIDELDVRGSAGGGSVVDSQNIIAEWRLSRDLVRYATNAPTDRIKILTVVGDSMPGVFNPFDKVIVDTTDTQPTPPGIFVVFDGLGLVIKRVRYIQHSDPMTVEIMSDNPKYPPYQRTLDEAYIQGRVLGKWLWI